MIINIEDLKKKIIYRSRYRGTKEMDKLLSSFTNEHISNLNKLELVCLCNLLDLDDENLFKYNQGEKVSVIIEDNKVTQLLKNYIYKIS